MTESEVFLLLLSRLLLLQSSQYQPVVSTTVLLLNQSGGFNVNVCVFLSPLTRTNNPLTVF